MFDRVGEQQQAVTSRAVTSPAPGGMPEVTPEILQKALMMGAPKDVYTKLEKMYDLQQMGKEEEIPIVEEKAKEKDTRLIESLEDLFFGTGEEKPLAFAKPGFAGRLPGTTKLLERAISPGEAGSATERLNTYMRTLESVRPQLAKMAGDVGNIAFAEQLQAGKGLPQPGDTPTEAIEMMQASRAKFGMEPSAKLEQLKQELTKEAAATSEKTLAGKAIGAGKKVGRFFFGESIDFIKDVKQSVGMDKKIEAFDRANKRAQELIKEGKTDEAEAILDSILEESSALAEGFSESVDRPAWERGLGVGLEAATAISMPGAIKGASKATMAGSKALFKKAFTPKTVISSLDEGLKVAKSGTNMRNVAIKTAQKNGSKVDGTKIYKGVLKWAKEAKRAFPKSGAEIDSFTKGLKYKLNGKKLTVNTVKRIWDLTDSGYTQAGKTGTGAAKTFYRSYRSLLRAGLEKAAPGFDKGTKLIRKGLKQEKLLKPIRTSAQRAIIKKGMKAPIPEFLKKTGGKVVSGVGTGLGLAALAKILGIRFSGAAESPR